MRHEPTAQSNTSELRKLIRDVVCWSAEDMARHRGARGKVEVSGRELRRSISRLYKAATGKDASDLDVSFMEGGY